MMNRIFKGWTLQRVCYLAAGIFLVVSSITQQQWPGIAFGGYLVVLGLSGWGCGRNSQLGMSGNTTAGVDFDFPSKKI